MKYARLLCSVLALFCFISMYMPVIAPRYPVGDYYAPAGNSDYLYTGDYYLARSYWSITDYAFANFGIIGRVIISLAQAMLIIWAWLSVKGDAGKWGILISVINLAVAGTVVGIMLGSSWACRWVVLVIMMLSMIAAVVMAYICSTPQEKNATRPIGKPSSSRQSDGK